MVKKAKTAAKAKVDNANLSENIRAQAQHIWMAGLGAFARAQEGGNKVFEALMKEGHSLQARTREVAERQVEEMAAKATGAWDKLETVFEDRVARSLNTLGVPTHQDIKRLSQRVDALAAAVEGRAVRKAAPKAADTAKKPVRAAAPVKKAAAKPRAKKVVAAVAAAA